MMDFITFMFEHSWDILRLATAFALVAVGIFCFYLCQIVFHTTKLIKKANKTLDTVNRYIRKPVQMVMRAKKWGEKIFHWIGGKK